MFDSLFSTVNTREAVNCKLVLGQRSRSLICLIKIRHRNLVSKKHQAFKLCNKQNMNHVMIIPLTLIALTDTTMIHKESDESFKY